jgi:hypothetical protein
MSWKVRMNMGLAASLTLLAMTNRGHFTTLRYV